MISLNDFEYMGVGIERRFARCSRWWAPHLACTREFIAKQAQRSSSVAVLGAGRLLDLDLHHLLSISDTVHLFDADPRCVAAWKKQCGELFATRVVPHIGDLTDSFDEWTRGLKTCRGSNLADYLRSLVPAATALPARYDGVISLNLLGQIPLYWRDRVRAKITEVDSVSWDALTRSMGALQRAHLDLVHQSATSWSVIISDTEYYFYDIDESDWRVEPALFGEAERAWGRPHERVTQVSEDSWLWHIAPQLIESEEEGEIHKVQAQSYRYR